MTAAELQGHRTRLGYSVAVLAEILGVESAQLKAWEAGEVPIPENALLDVAFRALTRNRRNAWPLLVSDADTLRT